ncbi:MAG: hypothetical protein K6G83_07050 [Lachnospiraceae bacterium]|nr:hypothetical protein [Lachnospiraceae bacterium]
MEKRKRELLQRLETFFKNDEDIEEASLFTAEELQVPVDMLRVLVLDYGPDPIDVLAEYSFLPVSGGEEVWYFSSVLTIMSDVPKEGVPALSCALAKLNFYLPYGSFALSGDGKMLIYKSVTAVRADSKSAGEDPDDRLYEEIELAADTALLVPEGYTGLLRQVADGTLLLDDFLTMLPQ